MYSAAKMLLLSVIVFVSAQAFAASGPTYTATLKVNARSGNSLTIKGKGIDLYSLLGLSTVDSGKGKAATPVTMTEKVAVFTSNGNARLTFFSTNGNGSTGPFSITYLVKVSKNSTTAKATNTNKAIKFTAVLGAPDKSNFTFVFTGTQVDTAVAGLPTITKGKNQVPVLADKKTGVSVTNFTLQLGSSTFVVPTAINGKIIF